MTTRYIPKEASGFQKALPWLIGLIGLAGLIALGVALNGRVQSPQGSRIMVIDGGWKVALGYILGGVGILSLTSWVGVWQAKVAGRTRVSYWAVLGDQLTHLAIWLVILCALYPLIYVVFASFDPRNSLYSFAISQSDFLLFKAKIIPEFSNFTTENYAKLVDGVKMLNWQWVFVGSLGVSLLALAVMALYSRVTGETRSLQNAQAWGMRILVISIGLWVVTVGPGQFAGQSSESKFLLHIRNTLLVSGLTGLSGILLSTTAGYAMARLRFPGRFETLLFFIFVQMFPGFLGLVAIFYLLYQLGLLNTFTGLVLAYSGGAIAFNTWIYKGYVESLPTSLEEAAMVDGATRWQIFYKIVLPLSGPMLVFIFLNQFIGTYAEFILSNVVLTGVDNWTVGMSLRNFTSGQLFTKWGLFSAASVVGALPIVALFYGFQQYFAGGTVAGGVKE